MEKNIELARKALDLLEDQSFMYSFYVTDGSKCGYGGDNIDEPVSFTKGEILYILSKEIDMPEIFEGLEITEFDLDKRIKSISKSYAGDCCYSDEDDEYDEDDEDDEYVNDEKIADDDFDENENGDEENEEDDESEDDYLDYGGTSETLEYFIAQWQEAISSIVEGEIREDRIQELVDAFNEYDAYTSFDVCDFID